MPCFFALISSRCRTRSVSMRPGMIWLTRMPVAASSSASVFASADDRARSTVDNPRFGIGSFTDDDVDIRIAPPPRALHRRHRRAHHAQRAEQQQLRRILPRGIVERQRQTGRRPARVGHQGIDAAEGVLCRLRPIAGCASADRTSTGMASTLRARLALDPRPRVLDRRFVTRRDRHASALAGQCAGDSVPESFARPGDERHFVFQLKIHLRFSAVADGLPGQCSPVLCSDSRRSGPDPQLAVPAADRFSASTRDDALRAATRSTA